jgi:hypothetical protein
MVKNDLRDRALDLRGFVNGYMASSGNKPGPHTRCTLPDLEGLCHELDDGLKQFANFSRTMTANSTSLIFGVQ